MSQVSGELPGPTEPIVVITIPKTSGVRTFLTVIAANIGNSRRVQYLVFGVWNLIFGILTLIGLLRNILFLLLFFLSLFPHFLSFFFLFPAMGFSLFHPRSCKSTHYTTSDRDPEIVKERFVGVALHFDPPMAETLVIGLGSVVYK